MIADALTKLLDTIGKRNGHKLPDTNDEVADAAMQLALWKQVQAYAEKQADTARIVLLKHAPDGTGNIVIVDTPTVVATAEHRAGAKTLDRNAATLYAISKGLDVDTFIDAISVTRKPTVMVKSILKV